MSPGVRAEPDTVLYRTTVFLHGSNSPSDGIFGSDLLAAADDDPAKT